ncbi:MAG: PmoA family protein [Armatimonadetes bacterium]|nr:PmoA family protein [Armatimonadota bacterium]
MSKLQLQTNCLGFELWDGDHLVTLYRVTEELPRTESPKPCFAPIYTPSGKLITEYRPADHAWHTGLYYGWVHVNDANLWGGPWYLPEIGKYEYVPNTHGRQAHESFDDITSEGDMVIVKETVTWRNARDDVMATEQRRFEFTSLTDRPGTFWSITSIIEPKVGTLTMSASKAARYSGLELRMGPPFADADHHTSEGRHGHEAIMGTRARWCCAVGACGGAVVMFDHPSNPRYPTCWFTRKNLMGAGLLMEGELTVERGESLRLRYGVVVLEADPADSFVESLYEAFAPEDKEADD